MLGFLGVLGVEKFEVFIVEGGSVFGVVFGGF